MGGGISCRALVALSALGCVGDSSCANALLSRLVGLCVGRLCDEVVDASPLELVLWREERGAERAHPLWCRRGERTLHGPRERDLVDIEPLVDLRCDPLERQKGADEQDDVRRRVHPPLLAHLEEDG